jgi:F-type H+-transporting ATPase subunit b
MFFLAFAESIQLFPDGTMFVHIALILIMIAILNRTFFKPINRVIEARERNKGGHSSEAEGILREVSEKESHYNQAMLEARSKGYGMIEQAHAAAAAAREQQFSSVKAETAERLAKEKSDIERQTAEARAAIEADAETIAEKISANILKTA